MVITDIYSLVLLSHMDSNMLPFLQKVELDMYELLYSFY